MDMRLLGFGMMGGRLLMVSVCLSALPLLSGCSGNESVVWRQELLSPDGQWTAITETRQVGGFGTAWTGTTVSLKNSHRTWLQRALYKEPFAILAYPGDGSIKQAYILSSKNADTKLGVTWLDSKHLQVDYTGETQPSLEVVRYNGVAIRLRVGSSQLSE